ncbi:ABC transporter permease [Thermoflavimicrobium dichotomicum]|uniref:Putative ABC transport system permease protein/putative ABC transport system permease protein n=1 Tax=Thermoflavimicrobium dichotomicum TaxID=46223 RepID=A0A1I3LUW3_9BACL|nr:ABC transporter permease [Thermoflavimicrobium dichotomicum]SFI88487.1 putative ABC transport system permease protein/putative ABC transport system permease protein [Thermoflavimicrobium dichotomicum]
MNLRSLAFKNVKHHMRSYLAYFLSCTFSVWMFYLYASLLFHPILQSKEIPKQFMALMFLVEGMVGLFSILFIGYSQSAFLRNRKHDLGLLQCLGMSVKHVTRIIFWENMMVGCLAIGVGVCLGLVFSKLFYLLVSVVLDLTEPISFAISFQALGLTIVGFLLIFSLLSWWSRFTIRKQSIADLFREAVKEKPAPAFSTWKVVLSLLCLGGAYFLAWTADLKSLVQQFVFIFLLVLIGTQLLFTQLSVAIIDYLQKKKPVFYHGTNLILLSQLRFRLKDNARILFMVSILCSVVLTSVSVCFTYYIEAEKVATDQTPFHLSIEGNIQGMSPQEMEQHFKHQGLQVIQEEHVPLILAQMQKEKQMVSLMSQSDYQRLTGNPATYALSLHLGEMAFIDSSGMAKDKVETLSNKRVNVKIGDRTNSFQLVKHVVHRIWNEHAKTKFFAVVTDQQFNQLKKWAPDSQQLTIHAYRFSDWKKSKGLVLDLDRLAKEKKGDAYHVQSTYELYQAVKEIFSPLMFVSLFIGVLFFLGAGSILYFRIFTELPSDVKQWVVLHKIGMRKKEGIFLLKAQIFLLFSIPFVVGICHASAAMHMFSALFKKPIWDIYGMSVLAYMVIYGLYYGWTKRMYMHDVLKYVNSPQSE